MDNNPSNQNAADASADKHTLLAEVRAKAADYLEAIEKLFGHDHEQTRIIKDHTDRALVAATDHAAVTGGADRSEAEQAEADAKAKTAVDGKTDTDESHTNEAGSAA